MSTQPITNPEGSVESSDVFDAEERVSNFASNSSGRRGDLDHGLRQYAGYMALTIAGALYFFGFLVVITAVWPSSPAAPFLDLKPQTQIAIIAAMFTVPTVILLAVLKATNGTQEYESGSAQEAIGAYVLRILDKFSSSK